MRHDTYQRVLAIAEALLKGDARVVQLPNGLFCLLVCLSSNTAKSVAAGKGRRIISARYN